MIAYSGLLRRTVLSAALKLPPEIEEGPLEYKVHQPTSYHRLCQLRINTEEGRLAHLTTQLKWRLSEGQGIAWYMLGVKDNGAIIGMPVEMLEANLELIKRMADAIQAVVNGVDRIRLPGSGEKGFEPRWCAQVTIKQDTLNTFVGDRRVLVVGGEGVGKSTLIAALLTGEKDDGRGALRLKTLKHRHELLSGRTSSVSVHALASPSGLVHLIDSAGLPRYLLKTALSALTVGEGPDAICVVSACGKKGESTDDKQWLKMGTALGIPVMHVQTKRDLISSFVPGDPAAIVSAVTGVGIEELRSKIAAIPPRQRMHKGFIVEDAKVLVDSGLVFYGSLNGMRLCSGQTYRIFPQDMPAVIDSVHRERAEVSEGISGQMVSCAVDVPKDLDWKGSILTDAAWEESIRLASSFSASSIEPPLITALSSEGTLFLNGNRLAASFTQDLHIKLPSLQVVRNDAVFVFVPKGSSVWHVGRIKSL